MPSYNVISPTLSQIAITIHEFTEALNTATAVAKAIAKVNPGHEIQVADASSGAIRRRCYGAFVQRIEVIAQRKPESVTPPPNRFAVNPADRPGARAPRRRRSGT